MNINLSEDLSGESVSIPDAIIYMIGVEWCPWTKCVKSEFISMGPTKTICEKLVAFRYLDGENDKGHLPCEVDWYPTICLVYRDKIHYYDNRGQQDVSAWIDFVQSILGGGSA